MSSGPYFTHKGIVFPGTNFYPVEHLNYVENEFQLMDDDVVSVVYPKSGRKENAWSARDTEDGHRKKGKDLRGSVERICRFLGKELTSQQIDSVVENASFETMKDNKMSNFSQASDEDMDHSKGKLMREGKSGIWKNYLTVAQNEQFDRVYQEKMKGVNVIYTVRNLKDVLVSSFYFHKVYKCMRDPGTMQDLLDNFLSGNAIFGSWFDHVKGWLAMKDKPNVLINTYEEMQQDLRGSVERICRFLGKELTSQQIDSVVENASFETMKDNKMSNFSQASDEDMDHRKSGIWKNYLTVAQNEQFERVYQEKMKGVRQPNPELLSALDCSSSKKAASGMPQAANAASSGDGDFGPLPPAVGATSEQQSSGVPLALAQCRPAPS
ncbi:sulfotransferase 2A1-like [Tiliqua scincoides]|uniref:sulfotransferase 2A1-like n=1 Tax=Tiliqua scincoides TaxID=71010 RepID=UPI003462F916